MATPVTLPLGRLRLVLTPFFRTLSLPRKTIGTVDVRRGQAIASRHCRDQITMDDSRRTRQHDQPANVTARER